MALVINDVIPRVQLVTAAAQTVFTVPFAWRGDADLVVLVDGEVKALNTDYTLVGFGETGGGTCTTWYDCDTSPFWGYQATGPQKSGIILVELAATADHATILASCYVDLTAEYDSGL